jgi:hypothetical protein
LSDQDEVVEECRRHKEIGNYYLEMTNQRYEGLDTDCEGYPSLQRR